MRESGTDSPPDDGRIAVVDPDAITAGTDPLGIGAGTAPPGTYVLIYAVDAPLTVSVGALGTATFDAGAYAYVGSAFGSNGLGRVDRHRRVAAGEHDTRHWHVDYLAYHSNVSLDAVVAAPRADVECRAAAELDAAVALTTSRFVPLYGFGASDCACASHLFAASGSRSLRETAADALRGAVRK